MRWDEYSAGGHPYLNTPHIDRLASEGILFENAYHVTPLCSPNRASILTGQYSSMHGIVDNVARDRASHKLDLFPVALQKAGYETAHVGKWHMGNEPVPRPGYDHWVCLQGQGRIWDPVLYENDRFDTVPGYITDVLTDRAIEFIGKKRDKPFFLYLGHKAVHPDMKQLDDGSLDLEYGSQFIPASKYDGLYAGEIFPKRENALSSYEEVDSLSMLGKILAAKNTSGFTEQFGSILDHFTSQETIQKRAEMIMSIDESVGSLLEELEQKHMLENTFILFTSDNGYFFGEHGLSLERRLPYEESVKSPLLVMYPSFTQQHGRRREFVLSIDYAPTILELAGAQISSRIHGRSLLPLLKGPAKDWRTSFLMEYNSFENPFPWLIGTDYKALRMDQYKYIHWVRYPELNELYDLINDPMELHNLFSDKTYQKIIDKMEKKPARQISSTSNSPPERSAMARDTSTLPGSSVTVSVVRTSKPSDFTCSSASVILASISFFGELISPNPTNAIFVIFYKV